MKINANELLLLNKKVRFGEDTEKPTQPQIIEQPTTQEAAPQAGMNALMFQGMNNVVSNPQFATNLNAMKEEVSNEQPAANNQDETAPLKTNVAFQGKASKFKGMAMSALMGLMTLGALSSMQSCTGEGDVTINDNSNTNVTTNVTVNYYTDESKWATFMDMFQQYIDNQEKNNAQTQEQLNALKTLVTQLLTQMKNDSENSKVYYEQMFKLLTENNANQQIMIDLLKQTGMSVDEAKAFIQQLLQEVKEGKLSAAEAMKKLLDLINDIKVSLDDIKASLDRAEKDRAEFKELLQNNNTKLDKLIEQGNTIIESDSIRNAKLDDLAKKIENLDIDMNSNFAALAKKLDMNQQELINVLMKLGYTQAQITKMTAAQILAAIKENTAVSKENNELMKDGFNMLAEILKQQGNKAEAFGKQVLNYIAAVGFEMNRNFTKLIEEVQTGNAKLDDITLLLNAINQQVKQNGEDGKKLGNDILNYLAAIGYEMNRNFTAVLDAINSGNKGAEQIKSLLEKVLEKQDQNMNRIDTNCKAIIEAMGNIKVDGGKIDLSSIEAMLRELLAQSKKNGNTLSSIDGKLDVIQITEQAILDKINAEAHKGDERYAATNALLKEILNKVGKQNGSYDDGELLKVLNNLSNLLDKKLDDILKAIKDHDVKVTVDVTGKVKCECNCGSKDEGIIGDLLNAVNGESASNAKAHNAKTYVHKGWKY